MNRRRLYRCRHDQRVAGVAAGLAEYLDIDIALVRVLWLVSMFFTGGFTLVVYIVMAIVVPVEPAYMPPTGPWQPGSSYWGQPAPGWAPPAGAPGTDPAAPGTNPGPESAGAQGTAGTEGAAPGAPGSGNPGQYWAAGSNPTYWGEHPASTGRDRGSLMPYIGVVLIVLGALALVAQLTPWNTAWLWPAFILVIGVLLVIRSVRRDDDEQ